MSSQGCSFNVQKFSVIFDYWKSSSQLYIMLILLTYNQKSLNTFLKPLNGHLREIIGTCHVWSVQHSRTYNYNLSLPYLGESQCKWWANYTLQPLLLSYNIIYTKLYTKPDNGIIVCIIQYVNVPEYTRVLLTWDLQWALA